MATRELERNQAAGALNAPQFKLGKMHLPDGLRKQIVANVEEFCRTVRKVDPEEAVAFIVAGQYLASQVEFYLEAFALGGIDPHKASILEIGSGYGFFLSYARGILGWNIHGIEPGEKEFSGRHGIAESVLEANGAEPDRLIRCVGERLSFPDGRFDAVISNDVLEHVADPAKVMKECARVLKPGGLLVFNIPNYRWIYEGHYNIPWIPSMSMSTAKSFVSMLGRDVGFVETLNFLTPSVIQKMVEGTPELTQLCPLSYKCEESLPPRIEAYIDAARSHSRTGLRIGLFKGLHALSKSWLFKRAMAAFARATGIHHEMHLVARKR